MRTSEELTSRKNEDEIPKILKRLEARYQKAANSEHQALDTVLATNMISVGVDIDRLGSDDGCDAAKGHVGVHTGQ